MKRFSIILAVVFILAGAAQAFAGGFPWSGGGNHAVCSQKPVLEYTAALPSGKVVPNNKPLDVVLTGKVTAPQGCTIKGAWTLVKDEYGEFTAKSPLTLGPDGSFSAKVTVEASRKGSDMDGRQYLFGVAAEDEAGSAEGQTFEIRVLHDQRK